MTFHLPNILCLSLACLSLNHCSPPQAPPSAPTTPEERPSTTVIGRVVSVSADGSFVLIERLPSTTIAIGSILSTRSDQHPGCANLVFTGEAKGNYIAADIQSGTPKLGDEVHLHIRPEPQDRPNPAPEAAEGQPAAEAGN